MLFRSRKETAALCRVVRTFLDLLPPNSSLKIQTDSITARAAFVKGSAKPHINLEVRSIRVLLAQKGIFSTAEWIPGTTNVQADFLSRKLTDRNDYAVPLNLLCQVWEQLRVQPTLDMFAADHNHRLPRFWSWNPSPFSLAQDAFQQNWSQESQGTMYANPPWPVIHRFLLKARLDRARIVFCLPHWKGQAWWPLLMSLLEYPLLIFHGPAFLDRWGTLQPAPKWKICFGILNGCLPQTKRGN